jgi:hypothetical protein
MQFKRFLELLSKHLGEHQLPVNDHWLKATGIVREDAVHYNVMKELLCRVYRLNRCTKPVDPIELGITLDCLGVLHHDMEQQTNPDYEAMQLVQRIGEFSVELLSVVDTDRESTIDDQSAAS